MISILLNRRMSNENMHENIHAKRQILFCLHNKVAFVFEEIIMVMLHEIPLSTFVFVIDRQYSTSFDESKRCTLACYIMT